VEQELFKGSPGRYLFPFILLEMRPLNIFTPETSPGQISLTTEAKENQLSPDDGGEKIFSYWFPSSFTLLIIINCARG